MELDAPVLLPLVREAVADRRPLRISYYSASTDRVTEREIAPLRLFASEGHWYVDAWCRTAGDLRRFRVDRINAAEALDADFPPEAVLPAGPHPAVAGAGGAGAVGDPSGRAEATGTLDPFVPGPDSRRVRLSLDPSTAWLVESVPSTGPATEVGGPDRGGAVRGGRRLAGATPPPARSRRPGDRPPRATGPWPPRPPPGCSDGMNDEKS